MRETENNAREKIRRDRRKEESVRHTGGRTDIQEMAEMCVPLQRLSKCDCSDVAQFLADEIPMKSKKREPMLEQCVCVEGRGEKERPRERQASHTQTVV